MPFDARSYRIARAYEEDTDEAKEACGETVDELVERMAEDFVKQTDELANNAAKQALYIKERHGLVRQLQGLEPKENLSISANASLRCRRSAASTLARRRLTSSRRGWKS